MGIQSRTNDYQDRERLTKVPKGGNWQQHKQDTTGNENRASGAIRTMRVFGVYGLVCTGVYSLGGFWFSRTPSDYNPYAFPHRRNATATTETTYNNATSRRRRRSTNFCKPTTLKGIQSNFLHRHKCKDMNK
jgi:hypothetical protein